MADEHTGEEASEVLRFLNEATSAQELAERIELPGRRDVGRKVAESIMARRTALGGKFQRLGEVDAIKQVGSARLAAIVEAARQHRPPVEQEVEVERRQFRSLLLQNPNYFGSLEASIFKPVKLLHSNTNYEELVCVGLNPPFDRLEGIIHVKRPVGYGGDICAAGTLEYVRFYVDSNNNGVWHDVGMTSVRVHDIPGNKPLCYAVKLDFDAAKKLCFFDNNVKVRAILSWNAAPPAATPNFTPIYGNVLTANVQIQPAPFIIFDDFVKQFELIEAKLPDPIGPIIAGLDPETKLQPVAPASLNFAQKRALYAEKEVPLHRFGFTEAHKLLAAPAMSSEIFTAGGQTPLLQLGLETNEIAELLGKLFAADGDTSFEELTCVGLYPAQDVLEGVLTVKQSNGYSGAICTTGSTEYVAFWIDFGTGFDYIGTATVKVHDIQPIPAQGLQYAVFLKANLAKRLVPCEAGPRVVRLRAILSWETPPPPTNPNFVPVWGNREECLIQLRPGELTGHIPLIETVGDMGVDDIDQITGLATGNGVIAAFAASQSPFGGVVTITGRIGDPPDSFGGGAPNFKYKIEVSPAGVNDWHPLTQPVTVKISEFISGVPVLCAPFQFVCETTLTATDDGDGLGDGWYTYLDDITGPDVKNLIVDKLGTWTTNASMEGLWKIRITAKDPSTSPPTIFPGVQEVKVRIDNTAPTLAVAITGATFNGNPIPAVDCGKFPVGTIISGTYGVHDPGTSAPDQHFGSLSLSVSPAGPAHGATVSPSSRAFPIVPTTGEDGTWTLNTTGMDPCGYVIRLTGCDRTIVNSGFVGFCPSLDIGFCLE